MREVEDPPAPEEAFASIGDLPFSLWLDSSHRDSETGRFSFVACQPFAVLRSREGVVEWEDADGVTKAQSSFAKELDEALDRWAVDATDLPLPFAGGAAGYIGYELATDFESLPRAPESDSPMHDAELAFFDSVVGWDHLQHRCFAVSTGRPRIDPSAAGHAENRLRHTLDWLKGRASPSLPALKGPSRLPMPDVVMPASPTSLADPAWLRSSFGSAAYEGAVARIIELIAAGDVFQVNLSQRFETPCDIGPRDVFSVLRRLSPAPYGGLFNGSTGSILSSSPERFLRLDSSGRLETRPIKGTRPRSSDPAEDAVLAAQLIASEKDRAENLMIVDLMRNDLSRVCIPGSMRVDDLFRLESWATVHHLVSTVAGMKRSEATPGDLLAATFPPGSVTGAPKIRAMEIIADLEPVIRGPYCGAFGYFSFGGQMDLAVAIRILVRSGDRAWFHAGGGVVFDSRPQEEYRETLAKADAMLDAVRPAGAGGPR